MLEIKSLLEKFIFASIVLSGFDGIAVFNIFLFPYGYFWMTSIGLFIYFFYFRYQNVYITNVLKGYCLFFLWVIFSTIINLPNIIGFTFKGIMAEKYMILELMSLVFLFLMIIYYTEILLNKTNIISWIYKAIRISFYITLVFAFIQFLAMLDIDIANKIYIETQKIFNTQYAHRFLNNYEEYITGISGSTKEPSAFGNYISVIFPWLILGTMYLKNNRIGKWLVILAIICVIYSYSRIAYFTISLEILIILFICKKNIFSFRFLLVGVLIISVGLYFIVTNDEVLEKVINVFFSFGENAETNRMSSNITRFSLQVAAFNMFLANPILGVGLGQFGFHYPNFLPDWAFLSSEILTAINPNNGIIYGSYNTHIRVLAESGIIGFILWVNIIIKGFKNYIYILKSVEKDKKYIVKLIILSYGISLLGFINFDIYIFFYYWFLVILSSVLVLKIKKGKKIL